ncbi:LysM peptidoglycan-binding domain-containing protein [Streptococcus tangpeifui]|uniref:aggregation-promoting factor n=1 Tax=Streptococcus tangpeifui TaxID=2709400 RepID=UPI0013EDB1CF|nr:MULTISPECIES: LysM domain-containing protein [unclassified Streptococcus]
MSKKSVLKDIRYSKKLALAGLSAAAAFGATTVAHVVHAETYTVQAGDTLSEIAESHNTTVDNLAQTNNISNPDFIFAGQTIEIGGSVSNLGAAQAVQDDVNTVDQAVASAEEVPAQPQEDFDTSATSEAVVTDYSQDTAATSEVPVQEEAVSVAASEAPQAEEEAPVQEDTATQAPATSSEAPAQDQAPTDQATATTDTTSEAPTSEETGQTASSEEAQAPQDANAVVSEETASSEAPQEDTAPASEAPETAPAPESAPAPTGYSSNLSAADAAAKEEIAQRESGGSYTAENGSYYGRYQLTRDYLNNDLSEENQEKTADDYVNGRYGSWSAALDYWNANGWY